MFGPASCINSVEGCFCEIFTTGNVFQPVNAITSLFFAILGIYLLLRFKKTSETLNIRYIFHIVFSIALIVTGLGSAYYHSRFDLLGQTFDFTGMFMILISGPVFIILKDKLRLRNITLSYVVIIILCIIGLFVIPEIRRYVFGIGVITLIISVILGKSVEKKLFFTALSIFVVSFGLWIIDNFKLICFSNILLNLHAWWHILNVVASYYLYKFYCANFDK
jgi:hypothetical protein